jgi:hypothetical protein
LHVFSQVAVVSDAFARALLKHADIGRVGFHRLLERLDAAARRALTHSGVRASLNARAEAEAAGF